MKKIIYIFCFVFCAALTAEAQHSPLHTQYMYNPVIINPGYAGTEGPLCITSSFRKQWTGIDGSPETAMLTAHSRLKDKKNSVGLLLMHDKIGVRSRMDFSGLYSYTINLNNSSVSFGVSGGIERDKNEWNSLEIIQTNDPMFLENTTKINATAGAGFFYHSRILFGGVAVPQLLGNTGYAAWNVQAGIRFFSGSDWMVQPVAMIRMLKASPSQIDAGATVTWRSILSAGVSYRTGESISLLARYAINDQLSAGYSYDRTTGIVGNYTAGSHEVILRYLFRYEVNNKSVRFF